MPYRSTQQNQRQPRFVLAILIGISLIPFNAYWIAVVSGIYHSLNPAYASLYIAPVINLIGLLFLNRLLARIGLPLRRAELLIVYQMLVMLCLVSGHNPMDFQLGTLIYPYWFASPENEYATLFHKFIPDWFTVRSKPVLRPLIEGESTLYTAAHLLAWVKPVLLWSGIIFTLFFVLICINSIQRHQWTEREKLSYPIAQLPLEMTNIGFLRRRWLWIGITVSASIQILNGLNFLLPTVPTIPLKFPRFGGQIFTAKPWNAIGQLPLYFYPWVVGLTFLVPLDLSFSVWFFFLLTKLQLMVNSMGGWKSLPGFPYYNHQGLGAWITLGLVILWQSRNHLKSVLARVTRSKADSANTPDEAEEPMRYRSALSGICIGVALLVALFQQAGMSVAIILAFLVIYAIIAISITYARATVGLPYHEIIWTHPQLLLVSTFGTRVIGPSNLTVFSFLYPLVRDNVSHPMPSQLEGFKIAERANIGQRKMLLAMCIGLAVSSVVSFWAYLHLLYQHGANHANGYFLGIGRENFDRLLRIWLQNPQEIDTTGLSFSLLASLSVVVLMMARRRFIWWPFHPAGYALGLSAGTVWVWSAVLVGWSIKGIVLKFGGIKLYRTACPFFLGLVLGDFIVGTVWSWIGMIFGIAVYRVWY